MMAEGEKNTCENEGHKAIQGRAVTGASVFST